jgi:hypothetical protein
MLNMIASHGYYGCTKCEIKGEDDGSRIVFKFNKQKPKESLRNNETYLKCLKNAEQKNGEEHTKGVKGSCILSSLKYFKPVESTCIDYMHSILEGVVKSLFEFWFESTNDQEFCLKKYMQVIDNRLLECKPPSFVPNTPRTIYTHNLWRAHEYLAFILYYSLPVFRDVMPVDYYNNLKKMVVIMENLLLPVININDLVSLEKLIFEFVEEAQALYPSNLMLSGMHEMVHLVDCTLNFGPLNAVNCFQFEEMNRKLSNFIHGYDLIGEELLKIFTTAKCLNRFKPYNWTRVFSGLSLGFGYGTRF